MHRIALAASLAALMLAPPAFAQGPKPAAGYHAPRAADGHPDLEGTWTNASLTRLERNPKFDHLALTEAEAAQIEGRNKALVSLGNKPTDPKAKVTDLPADCSDNRGTNCNYNAAWTDPGASVMRVAGQPRSGFITSPASGRIPMRAGVRPAAPNIPRGGAGVSDNPETRALGERCILGFGGTSGPIMLPVLYNNTYQIIQSPGRVGILVEMDHDVRTIRMDSRQHLPAGVRPWLGDSVGWWEGDTLVIETTNFHPEETLRGASDHLKVTERLTRVGKDRLHYAFWVEDPTVFTEAWGGEYEFARSRGPVYEYACHEGNYGLVGILAGARAEERTGVKTAPTNIDQVAKAEEGEEGGPSN
ncbi:MAG: hypothetical protein JWP49_1187 [Phenylobacterium sp.]|jgi:hypothetical protein|nr:hypothetical protein [Phenylobacterium sp.]